MGIGVPIGMNGTTSMQDCCVSAYYGKRGAYEWRFALDKKANFYILTGFKLRFRVAMRVSIAIGRDFGVWSHHD